MKDLVLIPPQGGDAAAWGRTIAALDGVAAQLDFFLGGAERCAQDPGPLVPQLDIPEHVIIPSAPKFCTFGFETKFPVTMDVTTPTGMTRTRSLPHNDDGEAATLFPFPPVHP